MPYLIYPAIREEVKGLMPLTPATNKTYRLEEICDPAIFNKVSSHPYS